jgi:2-iminobutanoate/2-iminopropanoate deaminase
LSFEEKEKAMKAIFSEKAPKPVGPYSQAVLAGNTLYLSGQIPLDPSTGALKGENVAEQTERVIENIAAVLEAVGAGFESVVKTTCFLTSIDDFSEFNRVYEKHFVSKPARSCVEVGALPMGALVEIELIAVIE